MLKATRRVWLSTYTASHGLLSGLLRRAGSAAQLPHLGGGTCENTSTDPWRPQPA
jgi:hypothetical protein